jgi:hypothetical protein
MLSCIEPRGHTFISRNAGGWFKIILRAMQIVSRTRRPRDIARHLWWKFTAVDRAMIVATRCKLHGDA